ncbi:M24 family metallopeptidase [Campylobacter corcagiensis]|uniref:Aminopeptidase P family protein n=1 Tax=Campylobacter corcagiensis TaxID=1448857 RepID=A0A7M1LFX4_9BACT|nr:M24 family metallopeptidase [Campylobacter corcagiensis]QKF64310.1 Xaa-Pro dipeptidase, M24 metallopeptidase family [Campylobacter corcagiensis]QOQ87502.1 aminopeptidase P family protein [Campylobacter corcagiensis]
MTNNFILKNENAVFYECGYSCDNLVFLNLKGEKFLITDSRYAIEAKQSVKECEVIESSELFKEARKLIRKFSVKDIIYDPNDFSVYEFGNLAKFGYINYKKRLNFSKKKRMIKSSDELEILRSAAKFGALGFEKFSKFISENGLDLDEKELFFEAENILKDRGNLGLSFEPIVAINENGAKAHALPSDKKLKNGDLLLFDAGVKFKRHCSDRTRTAIFDNGLNFTKDQNFTGKKAEIYEIVKEAQNLAIKVVKPGVMACEIDAVARDFIKKAGYEKEFFHSTGHGVGLDIHELPNINQRDKTILEKGMVFSIEPGIYIEGEFGVRIEDVVAVSENGCEIL